MISSQKANSSKVILRAELSSRIREALELRNWVQLEHWAKQWIQLDPDYPSGFKWLARATMALNQMPRAAYAYGRLLDFDPQNEEARNFFAQHPSSVTHNLKAAQSTPAPQGSGVSEHILTPEQRRLLAQKEFEMGETYSRFKLWAEAGHHYQKSFHWHPSKVAALESARTSHKQSKGLDATRFLRQQLYHYPDWSEGRLLLGRILHDLGHRSEAQREWQLVLERDPKNVEALNFLRGSLTSLGS